MLQSDATSCTWFGLLLPVENLENCKQGYVYAVLVLIWALHLVHRAAEPRQATSYAAAAAAGTPAAAEAAAREAGEAAPPPPLPRLQFFIGDRRLSLSTTIFQVSPQSA